MSRLKKMICLFRAMIMGMIAFLISGLVTCIIIAHFNYFIFATIIAGGLGGGVLSFLLRMRQKLLKMIMAGSIAGPVSMFLGFVLVEGFFSLVPSVSSKVSICSIPDTIAIILMAITFGAVYGGMVYNRKYSVLFAGVCGLVSVPFGILIGVMNAGFGLKAWLEKNIIVFGEIDFNLLVIIVSFGVGIGLSIGLKNTKTK